MKLEAQPPPEKKISITKIIALVGDVASITGISLLYLTQFKNMELTPLIIIKVLISVLIAFGYVCFLIVLIYRFWVAYKDYFYWMWWIPIFSIAVPFVLGLTLLFAVGTIEVVNKMINFGLSGQEIFKPQPANTNSNVNGNNQ